jgi:hypothetical protein
LKKSNNSSLYDELIAASNVAAANDVRNLANAFVDRDQSIKADGGKLRMELIPTSAYIGLGRVLTHGAEKYSPNSWQNVEYERYIGALIRHLVAFIDDPTGRDSDSGLLHTEHLLANAVFLNDAVAAGRIPTNERP